MKDIFGLIRKYEEKNIFVIKDEKGQPAVRTTLEYTQHSLQKQSMTNVQQTRHAESLPFRVFTCTGRFFFRIIGNIIPLIIFQERRLSGLLSWLFKPC